MGTIDWEDFQAVELRAGMIRQVEESPEANQPANKLWIDFGDDLGEKQSSTQITDRHELDELVGTQVLAVTNFPSKQIGPFTSEIPVTGFVLDDNEVVLAHPEETVPDSTRLR